MTLPRPIKALTGLAALVAAMCGAGVVWASVPEPDGTIHACALKIGGLLRVIDPAAGQRCHRQLETPLSWPSGRINFAGPWDPAVTYGEAEVVTLEGSAWIAVESSIGEQPGTGASWAMFAAAGERTEPTARWVPPVREGLRAPAGLGAAEPRYEPSSRASSTMPASSVTTRRSRWVPTGCPS